eukprot:COSAG01_NODE_46686_length_397_cov_14.590604_1_plen_41_part_10
MARMYWTVRHLIARRVQANIWQNVSLNATVKSFWFSLAGVH